MHRLLQLIEEIVSQELDEVNAIGAGGVSATGGSPLGQNMSPAHKKMWSGDKPLKDRKVQESNLADKMGLKKATSQVRRDVVGGSPVYMDRHDGDKEGTKKVMKKVAKNLNRKPYSKKPPMMGLAEGVAWLIEAQRLLTEAKIDVAIAQEKDPEIKQWLEMFKAKNIEPKFIPWVIRVGREEQHNWHGMGPAPDTVEVITRLLQRFNNLVKSNRIQQKDIDRYSWESLHRAVQEAENTPSASQQKKAIKNETEVFYQDNEYLILEPKSMAASCHYGYGTKWCISATQSQNYFDSYQRDGARFLFLINKQTGDKDAIAHTSGGVEIYDAQDVMKNIFYITEKYPAHIVAKLNEIWKREYDVSPFINYNLDSIMQNPDFLIYDGMVQDRFFQEPPAVQMKVLAHLVAQVQRGDIEVADNFRYLVMRIVQNIMAKMPGKFAPELDQLLKTDPEARFYGIGYTLAARIKSFSVAKTVAVSPTTVFPLIFLGRDLQGAAAHVAKTPNIDAVNVFAQVVLYSYKTKADNLTDAHEQDPFYSNALKFWEFAASQAGAQHEATRETVQKLLLYGNSVNWNFFV